MKKVFLFLMLPLGLLLVSLTSYGQVSLTATGGTPTGTFATVSAAFAAINAGTHQGNIVISINGNTTEPAAPTALAASGVGSANFTSVLIRPTVVAIISGATNSGRGVIELDGSDNVTIDGDIAGGSVTRDLTIQNTAAITTTNTAAVRLIGRTTGGLGATNITIKNCNIRGNTPGNSGTSGSTITSSFGIYAGTNAASISTSTLGDNYDNLTIENNLVTRAYYGIYVGSTTANVADNLVITDNLIGDAGATERVTFRGIEFRNVNGATISRNTVFELRTNASVSNAGISLEGTTASINNVMISRNRIYSVESSSTGGWGAYGINIIAGNNVNIVNNVIYDIRTTNYASVSTTFQAFGIRIAAGTGHRIYYNSINLFGNLNAGSTLNAISACLVVTGTVSTGLDIRNNVFSNKMTSTASAPDFVAVWFPTGYNFATTTMNNNGYFVSNTPRHFVGKIGTTFGTGNHQTLANWRAISQVGNPTNDNVSAPEVNQNAPFTSDTDLTIPAATDTPIEGGAVEIPSLGLPNIDHTGITRPAFGQPNPDMGAYEFQGFIPPPCSGSPVAGTAAASPTSVCVGANFSITLTGFSTGVTGITFQWQSSPDGVTFTNISGATTSVYSGTQSAETHYRCVVTCTASGGVTFSNVVIVTMNSPTSCYCTPPSMDCSGNDFISNVTFVTINNTTGCSASGYTFYPTPVPNVNAGLTYTLSVSKPTNWSHHVAVWIDFNRNGVFEASEFTQLSAAANTIATQTVNITIPCDAADGNTRMRVRTRFSTPLTPADACLGYSFGETEDYLINIVNPPCTGAPPVGTVTASATSVCFGTNFSLSWSAGTGCSAFAFQWQSSPDGVSFTNISGATTSNYSAVFSVSTYYRCVITCPATGESTNSSVVYVQAAPFTTCYCASTATSAGDTDIGRVEITHGTYGTILANGTATPILSNASATGMYSNFTTLTPTPVMYLGESYNATVFQITSGTTFYGARVKIFIDFNQNGLFTDPGEEFMASANTTNPPGNVSITVNVPMSALLGVTGMRVVMRESGDAVTTTACGTYTWGETEDYFVNICSGPPAAPTAVSPTTAATPLCSGSTATLTASGDAGATFQWYSALTGGTLLGSGASFTTPALASTTSYFVQQTTTCGTSTRTEVVVHIGDVTPPVLSACPANMVVCSDVATTVTWTPPTATDNCGGSPTISSTHAPGSMFALGITTVVYTATDAAGNTSACSFTVNVSASVPMPTASNAFACVDAVPVLSASGTGTFNWYSDAGLTTLVGTGSPFSPTGVTSAPGTVTFYVTQTIGACESPARTVVLTVATCGAPPPQAPSYLIVEGIDTKTLKLRFPDANGDEDGYEIYRSLDGTTWAYHTITPPSNAAEVVWFDSLNTEHDTPYFYIVRAKRGVSRSPFTPSAYDYTYPKAPTATVLFPACIGGKSKIKAVGTHNSGKFRWYASASTNNPYTGTDGMPFEGDVFDTDVLNETRTYFVTARGRRYESKPRTAVVVNVIPRPVANIVGSLSQRSCGNEIALAVEPVTGATYAWYLNGSLIPGATSNTYTASADGVYAVAVSNGSCATVSSPITVDVLYKPQVAIAQGNFVNFCESGVISAVVREGVSYEWYRGGSLLSSTASLIVNEEGTYTLKAIEFGCENTAEIKVSLLKFPAMSLTADNETVCAGERVTLTAPTFAGTYKWWRNGRVFRTSTTNTVVVTQSGEYAVELEHFEGCSKVSSILNITVNPVPRPTYTYVLHGNLTVNVPEGQTISSINWTLNGVAQADLTGKTEFKPTKPGVYEATVTYATGCVTTFSARVSDAILGNDEEISPETQSWVVYPNPTRGNLNVSFENAKAEKVAFQLFDNLGREVSGLSSVVSKNELKLDLTSLPNGTYLLHLIVGENSRSFKVVIAD